MKSKTILFLLLLCVSYSAQAMRKSPRYFLVASTVGVGGLTGYTGLTCPDIFKKTVNQSTEFKLIVASLQDGIFQGVNSSLRKPRCSKKSGDAAISGKKRDSLAVFQGGLKQIIQTSVQDKVDEQVKKASAYTLTAAGVGGSALLAKMSYSLPAKPLTSVVKSIGHASKWGIGLVAVVDAGLLLSSIYPEAALDTVIKQYKKSFHGHVLKEAECIGQLVAYLAKEVLRESGTITSIMGNYYIKDIKKPELSLTYDEEGLKKLIVTAGNLEVEKQFKNYSLGWLHSLWGPFLKYISAKNTKKS